MSSLQELDHPEGHDYESGSPHLKHSHLRTRINDSLRAIVKSVLDRKESCRVLEVGAGHGTFTDVMLGSGAEVVVTEMSSPSAELLEDRYARNRNVTVIYDPEGTWLDDTEDAFDIVACVSVLHHIPDYMSFLATVFEKTMDHGAFISWQDPMWYPDRSKWNRGAEKTAYFAWRLLQGDLRRGFSTRMRRVQGLYDESLPADMVEYHVVRDGVNQDDILSLGRSHFNHVEMNTYWSTQGRFPQFVGEQSSLKTTFGLKFTHKR